MANYSATIATSMAAPYGTIGLCESSHLCNEYRTGNVVHCIHAEGLQICVP
jgi:hypothetical protein